MQQPPAPRTLAGVTAGVLLAVIGTIAIIVALGPLHFWDRLSSRVEVPGVVVSGLSGVDEVDAGLRMWKVDYEIDGSAHTGVIRGDHHVGDQLIISAPEDGSVYAVLHEASTGAEKVVSWLLMLAGLALVGFGIRLVVQALARRNRQLRQEVDERFGRWLAPAPPDPWTLPANAPQQARPHDHRPSGTSEFFKPYDLD